MADYKEIENGFIVRLLDGATIPNDPRNRDRQEFDAWVESGGVPEPYVPPPPTELEKRALADKLAKEGPVDTGAKRKAK